MDVWKPPSLNQQIDMLSANRVPNGALLWSAVLMELFPAIKTRDLNPAEVENQCYGSMRGEIALIPVSAKI